MNSPFTEKQTALFSNGLENCNDATSAEIVNVNSYTFF